MNKVIISTFLYCIFFCLGSNAQERREAFEAQRPQEMLDYFDHIQAALAQGALDKVALMYDTAYTKAALLNDTVSMQLSKANQGELFFLTGKIDAAKKAFVEARPLCKHLPFIEYEAYNSVRLGSVYKHLGQNDSAFYYLRQAQRVLPQSDEKPLVRQVYNQLGILHDAVGQGDSAVHYYLQMMQTVDESEPYVLGAIHTNLGKSFAYRYNYETAIQHYDAVVHILDKSKYPKAYAIALANKAMSLQRNKQPLVAEEVILEAKEVLEQYGVTRLRVLVYSVWASILEELDKLEEAKIVLEELEQFGAITDTEILPEYLLTKTSLLLKLEDYTAFPALLEEAEASVRNNDFLTYNIKLHKLRSIYYEKQGQFKEANLALQNLEIYKDSLFKVSQSNTIHDLERQYQTKQKEQRIAQLELEDTIQAERIARQQSIIGIGGLALLLLSGLGYYIFKQNRKIKSQNALIQTALEEKNILLKEIHHRVKNNLQVISSLLGIQSRKIKDEAALEAITEGRTRVQTMSLIHQNLYKEDNLTGIEVQDYLGKLSHSLFNTYNINPDLIHLEMDIDDIILDVESVVPLGLIINELISNSLKYAFPNKTNGTIKIGLKDTAAGLQLSVEDNGIGVANTNQLFEGESFGYDLIDAFKTKLKADLDIDGRNGMRVQMLIRNYKKVA